jgi:hypothetical protein
MCTEGSKLRSGFAAARRHQSADGRRGGGISEQRHGAVGEEELRATVVGRTPIHRERYAATVLQDQVVTLSAFRLFILPAPLQLGLGQAKADQSRSGRMASFRTFSAQQVAKSRVPVEGRWRHDPKSGAIQKERSFAVPS